MVVRHLRSRADLVADHLQVSANRARGGNQQRRQSFLTAWEQHVGRAQLLAADSPEGTAVLELFRGEDPFSLVTQLRTTWS